MEISVNNVVKHSAANNVWLNVKRIDDGLNFVCRDDGKGFDFEMAKNSPESGLGLNGLGERVKILNGEYEIDSEIGNGTTVSLKFPKADERRNKKHTEDKNYDENLWILNDGDCFHSRF